MWRKQRTLRTTTNHAENLPRKNMFDSPLQNGFGVLLVPELWLS
jgi:hypothetical protein